MRNNCMYSIHTPLTQLPPTATSHHLQQPTQALAAYPPCGVQPFSGLAMYFAPLCYLFRDVCALYSVCRAMFARFWCKMNVISADEGTLVPVCKCFEALLVSNHPKLVFHMQSLGIQPLQVWAYLKCHPYFLPSFKECISDCNAMDAVGFCQSFGS